MMRKIHIGTSGWSYNGWIGKFYEKNTPRNKLLCYDNRTLERYAGKLVSWVTTGSEVFCYFDNDKKAYAPFNAKTLIRAVKEQAQTQNTVLP